MKYFNPISNMVKRIVIIMQKSFELNMNQILI